MKKSLAMAAAVLGLAAAAPIGAALAHPVAVRIDAPEFGIRIGVPVPPVFIPAPVVVAPRPVVVAPPVPVFAPAPIYAPAPVYAPPPRIYGDRGYYPEYRGYRASYEMRHRHPYRHWDARRGRWCDD
jgi:hypothetical protein